jgi:hypothetical protein
LLTSHHVPRNSRNSPRKKKTKDAEKDVVFTVEATNTGRTNALSKHTPEIGSAGTDLMAHKLEKHASTTNKPTNPLPLRKHLPYHVYTRSQNTTSTCPILTLTLTPKISSRSYYRTVM